MFYNLNPVIKKPNGSDNLFNKCINSNDYRIIIYKNFLTIDECKYIIKLSRDKLSRSTVMSDDNNVTNDRTSTQTWFKRDDDLIFKKISEKVSKLCNYPIENQESLQVLHYDPGQHYKPHYDACVENTKECIKDKESFGGYRVCTFLIYLNDVKSGGYTSFPNFYGLKVKPQCGKAVYFQNLNKNHTDKHPCSLHWAHKPEGNCEKWAMNIWIRQKKNNNQ